jgi:hypothetical protein
MDSKVHPKEIDLLNKIIEEASLTISSLKDLSEEDKIIKIISAM